MSGIRRLPNSRPWRLTLALFFVLAVNPVTVYVSATEWGGLGGSRGSSMEPASQEGDIDFIFEFLYRLRDPQRGDVIAFPALEGDGMYGKRIIGLPGETVEIIGTTVVIDGETLDEPYLKRRWRNLFEDDVTFDRVALGPSEYYVMGDNRDRSSDSRDFGPISGAGMEPTFIVFPLSRAEPLAFVGLAGLLLLIPGTPAACAVAAVRAARGKQRRNAWGLAGLLFLGPGVVLVSCLPSARELTPEEQLAKARARAQQSGAKPLANPSPPN